jgi:hypothetical protein
LHNGSKIYQNKDCPINGKLRVCSANGHPCSALRYKRSESRRDSIFAKPQAGEIVGLQPIQSHEKLSAFHRLPEQVNKQRTGAAAEVVATP